MSGKSRDYLKIMAVVSLRAWGGNWKKYRVVECLNAEQEVAKRGPSPNVSEVDSFHVTRRQTQCNL